MCARVVARRVFRIHHRHASHSAPLRLSDARSKGRKNEHHTKNHVQTPVSKTTPKQVLRLAWARVSVPRRTNAAETHITLCEAAGTFLQQAHLVPFGEGNLLLQESIPDLGALGTAECDLNKGKTAACSPIASL